MGPDVPVIRILPTAAPWTLACYMIEGRTRGDVSVAKQMLREQPEVVRDLLDRIARATSLYIKSQIAAGASVVQLFDTWAMELFSGDVRSECLSFPPRREFSNRFAWRRAWQKYFPAKSLPVTQHLRSLAKSGADVLSVDWNTDLTEARSILGEGIALQGNVDPSILLGARPAIVEAARQAVGKTGGFGHILNLGHGILPTTPVENAKEFVHRAVCQSVAPVIGASAGEWSAMNLADTKTLSPEKFEIGQLSDALLEKYNKPGPRYTSYPTAPVWKEDFGPDDLEKYYERADALATPISLYMHLPFLRKASCLFARVMCPFKRTSAWQFRISKS